MDPNQPYRTLGPQANKLIGRFHGIEVDASPAEELAFIAQLRAPGDVVGYSGLPGCAKTSLTMDLVMAAIAPARNGVAQSGLFQIDVSMIGTGKIGFQNGESRTPYSTW